MSVHDILLIAGETVLYNQAAWRGGYGTSRYIGPYTWHLEHQSSTLRLLVTTKLEVLAALKREMVAVLAHRALETQHNLLGC